MALQHFNRFGSGYSDWHQPFSENIGGIAVTVQTMLFWYVPTGEYTEALFTVPIVLSLSQVSPTKLHGLSILYDTQQREKSVE